MVLKTSDVLDLLKKIDVDEIRTRNIQKCTTLVPNSLRLVLQ